MACAPRAAPRACQGGGLPGPDLVGPEDRLIGPDPRISSQLARDQSFVRLIERESSDAIAEGWGTVIRVVKSCPGLAKLMARGVERTRWSLEDSERSDQLIQTSRPGPGSLQWIQAGTAGLQEYRPHNQGKARRGSRARAGGAR
jgi:hypothetical protein